MEQCRKLIPTEVEPSLSDQEVEGLRDMLYDLAEIVSDAFSNLATVDQALFDPPGDVVQWFNEGPFRPAPMKKGKGKAS